MKASRAKAASSTSAILSRQDKMGRLETLLSKAERYTQFLGRKLMAVAMDAGVSKESIGTGGKDSDEENNDGNKRKRRKSPRRAAPSASANKRAKTANGKKLSRPAASLQSFSRKASPGVSFATTKLMASSGL